MVEITQHFKSVNRKWLAHVLKKANQNIAIVFEITTLDDKY